MKKFNGITSLLFTGLCLLIGLYILWINFIILAIIYLAVMIIAAFVIPYVYCTKCPCRNSSCAHVFPGLITRLMPNRELQNYTLTDLMVVGIFLGIFVLMPQFWLIKNLVLFSIFWILLIIAFVQIRLFICKKCDNKKCLLCGQSA